MPWPKGVRPLVAIVVSHVIEYGADVTRAPKLFSSSRNWTPVIVEPGFAALVRQWSCCRSRSGKLEET